MTTSPTVKQLATFFTTMPILPESEINRLSLRWRRDIRVREQMFERIKTDVRAGVTAHDMMMRETIRAGERARTKKAETDRIVSEILATNITPDPEGPARLAALEADLATQRRTAS